MREFGDLGRLPRTTPAPGPRYGFAGPPHPLILLHLQRIRLNQAPVRCDILCLSFIRRLAISFMWHNLVP